MNCTATGDGVHKPAHEDDADYLYYPTSAADRFISGQPADKQGSALVLCPHSAEIIREEKSKQEKNKNTRKPARGST